MGTDGSVHDRALMLNSRFTAGDRVVFHFFKVANMGLRSLLKMGTDRSVHDRALMLNSRFTAGDRVVCPHFQQGLFVCLLLLLRPLCAPRRL